MANLIACVCFVVLIFAVIRDGRRRMPRGWMHWVGVATALVSMMISAAWIVVQQSLSQRPGKRLTHCCSYVRQNVAATGGYVSRSGERS